METKRIGSFVVDRIVDLPEIQAKLWVLEDEKTGARVLHCETDDQENAFCVSFATQPQTSNGVAHILEHTVLCGSKRFPVKDPFFLMQRRSLNTFLNAFTGGDFTCYPAATQNPKDFYNLLDVYLDAVFFPKIDYLSFLQEGHRLEYVNEKLQYSGIVFNEMKGALANPLARLDEAMNAKLYSGLTYCNNSGGDPKDIPNLTHEELVAFHREYYHPSRAIFYFYGNLPLDKHLEFLTGKVLNETPRIDPLPPMPSLKRFDKPELHKASYPISKEEDSEDKTIVSSSFVTCTIFDQIEALALSALTVILLETDASPLKLALLKSGLCKQVLAHIDTEISEIPISIIFRGVKAADATSLLETLHSLIKEISNSPFAQEEIDSALHQLELSRKEISHDHLPYGLNLFMRAGLLMQHGGKPEDALIIHSLFSALKERIHADPQYFNKLMKKWLVNNPTRVDFILEPDSSMEEKENAEEAERLAAIEKTLDAAKKEEIKEISKQLEALQDFDDSEQALILPMLELTDIPLDVQHFSLHEEIVDQTKVYFHDCFTNEILYATLSYDLPRIAIDELPILRLFTMLLTQIGTSEKSYVEMLQWMQAKTGGVYATLSLNQQIIDPNDCKPTLQIQGKSLYSDQEDLFKIMSSYATDPNFFDPERIKEIILKHFTSMQGSIASSSLKYASGLATKGFTIPSLLSYKLFGLEWYWTVKEWVDNLDQILPKLIEKLQASIPKFFGGEKELILSCNEADYRSLKENHFYGVTKSAKTVASDWKDIVTLQKGQSQGRIISSPVAFISCALKTANYSDPKSPAIHLASCLLDNSVLHTAIREKGGAYGGGSSYHANPGIFSFYSYRDPNIAKTIQTFSSSLQEFAKEKLTDDEIVESKLEMIQGFDSPVSPGSRALVAWSWLKEGKSKEMRQKYRERLIAADQKVIKAAIEEHLEGKEKVVIAFAGKDLLEKENKQLKKPLPVYSIDERELEV